MACRFLMSHELRAPFSSITGFSGLMPDEVYGSLHETYLNYANRINRTGKHLLALISDVIDISKIVAGRTEVELSEIFTR